MGLVVLGLKIMKKKEVLNFVHNIPFLNSQNVDYYVFSTIKYDDTQHRKV